jgi:23S rRNA (adenine2503-C2)-methyltransferase
MSSVDSEKSVPLPAVTERSPEDLEEVFRERGLPPYRARQVLRWLYGRTVLDYEDMTDLPKDLRRDLAAELPLLSATPEATQRSEDGTSKILLRLRDGRRVESVLIPEGERQTACVSTQVGCPAGCAFCASGLLGLERNLTAGEIVEQWLRLTRLARDAGAEGLTNLVVMGMGEPLANYDALMAAIRRLTDERTAGFGARRITVSTVGLPKRIDRLAGEGLAVNLALSLHAPDDETRSRIMPMNDRFPVEEVVGAARRYHEATGRDVTFEYILLDGLNDGVTHADRLAALAGRHFNVNLIPYNRVGGLPFRPTPTPKVARFAERLRARGVIVHVRRRRGDDIDAACGQLRRRAETEEPSRRGSS